VEGSSSTTVQFTDSRNEESQRRKQIREQGPNIDRSIFYQISVKCEETAEGAAEKK
jgi:hypothetical protein